MPVERLDKMAGIYTVDMETYEILELDRGLHSLLPKLKAGQTCYSCFGLEAPCAHCPVPRLRRHPYSIAIQYGQVPGRRLDVAAIALPPDGEGHSRALVCCGQLGEEERRWLSDQRYQTILQQTRTVAFEYDLDNGEHFVSPFVSELFSGTYDSRRLSDIMLEDGIIYPDDIPASIQYREAVMQHTHGLELVLRLKGRDGAFRWHKMSSCYFVSEEGRHMVVGTITNVDDEVRLRESLRYRAEYDTLTGIWNRETFLQKLETLLRSHPEVPRRVVRLDIDRFKTVNELFGFAEGDQILSLLADTLCRLAKPGELYGRMNGDVFCLCLTRTDAEVVSLLEEVNAKLNSCPIDFNFVLAAGILRVDRYDGQAANILCDRAALAQKRIKGNYVKRFAFYEEWMGTAFAREHSILSSMKRALQEREFLMYLQPKFDMTNGQIFGAEALSRWQHPHDGLLMPGEFIPLFEKNGFIIHLDEYIWEEACRTLRKWIDLGIKPIPISVNVSRAHLYDTEFCGKVLRLVEKYGLDPALLELEITESACVEDPAALFDIVEQLQSKGFVFSMDDFGSGYSSLSMLKDIPVKILKIDLHFLEQSRCEGLGRDVLGATIQMVQKLQFSVVAEGVETEEQAAFLLRSGCTKAQGYFYDKPVPLEKFEQRYLSR